MTDFVPFSLEAKVKSGAGKEDTRDVLLARHLVNFDAPPSPSAPPPTPDQADSDTVEASAVPLVSLSQDEIDALKQASYAKGHAEGVAAAQSKAETAFSAVLTDLLRQREDEHAHHIELAEKASEIFAGALVDTIVALTRLSSAQLSGIHRDLSQDAINLINAFETEVQVMCTAHDEARIRGAITEPDKIKFVPCADPADSRIRISTETNMIVLDPEEWRKRAVEKVLTSVTSLSRPATASPKITSGP